MANPKPAEAVALIDMDGTIVNYDDRMTSDLALIASPNEPPDGPWKAARVRLIRNQPGWWRRLPVWAPGLEIVHLLQDLNFTLMVLTKGPSNSVNAWSEKVAWVRENLPDVPVTITEDKGLVYGKVLVDDWPEYGIRWLEWRPRGLLVVPAHPWNTMDKYPEHLHPNILRYDRDNLEELNSRLQEIRRTAA